MGSANGMTSITEGIVASHHSRMQAARDRIAQVKELTGNAQMRVLDFASARRHMGTGQANALAEHAGNLRKATGHMIGSFQQGHAAMAAAFKENAFALKVALADGETARMKRFKNMMADIREAINQVEKSVQDIKTHVADKLAEFSGARGEMGRSLREDLAKFAADMNKETKAALGEARALVDGFARERTMMSAEWQGMAAAIARSRGAQPAAAKLGKGWPAAAKPKKKPHRRSSRKSA